MAGLSLRTGMNAGGTYTPMTPASAQASTSLGSVGQKAYGISVLGPVDAPVPEIPYAFCPTLPSDVDACADAGVIGVYVPPAFMPVRSERPAIIRPRAILG